MPKVHTTSTFFLRKKKTTTGNLTRAKSVLPGDRSVVPAELVNTVYRGNVVARYPANVPSLVLYLTPFSPLVVAQYCHLFSCKINQETQLDLQLHVEITYKSR